METMRYQENRKNGKGPIIAFGIFVVIGVALIYMGIANENSPEIVGSAREEVQSLVNIYSEQAINSVDNAIINVNDIKFKIEDEKHSDDSNKKMKADIVVPKIVISGEELSDINTQIKNKYVELFTSLKSEMSSLENNFTFKTTYKYYDNVLSNKRVLSITVHQRIVDDKTGDTTSDKVETYNIDMETKKIVEQFDVAMEMFGKDYKTIIKNEVKNYVVNNKMINEDEFIYSLTGLENYYIKDSTFHIIFNDSELVNKKYGVLDIEIKNPIDEENKEKNNEEKENKNQNESNKDNIEDNDEE